MLHKHKHINLSYGIEQMCLSSLQELKGILFAKYRENIYIIIETELTNKTPFEFDIKVTDLDGNVLNVDFQDVKVFSYYHNMAIGEIYTRYLKAKTNLEDVTKELFTCLNELYSSTY